jgi:hypothetical protein
MLLVAQVIIPVGAPEDTLRRYFGLVTKHRQVELQLLRSFYKEQQKSPFTFFPWKSGFMHLRFLPVGLGFPTRGAHAHEAILVSKRLTGHMQEETAGQRSPLAELQTCRKVLGIIGICHGPAVSNIGQMYAQFEESCRCVCLLAPLFSGQRP